MTPRNLIGLFAIFCLGLSNLVSGKTENDFTNDPISIFATSVDEGDNDYVFAVNVASGSNDLYFHLSAPAAYSWIAVGTGSEMSDSLMFIAYANSTGNGQYHQPCNYFCRVIRDCFADIPSCRRYTQSKAQYWRS